MALEELLMTSRFMKLKRGEIPKGRRCMSLRLVYIISNTSRYHISTLLITLPSSIFAFAVSYSLTGNSVISLSTGSTLSFAH